MKRILSTIAVVASMIGCTNPVSNNNPDPNDTDLPNVGSTDFYITGKVTNNGSPVKGAAVRLMKTGLTAISKDDGSYIITGTASASGLKKVAATSTAARISAAADVSYGDTLVITVANPNKPNDSSEVVKAPVTSGVIMDLPATYIVQREIRGYLTAEDEAIVGKIQAFVYDNSVPNQIKTIDLWHDAVNSAFSSFAYFSSETNKNYTLYVKIYDVDGKFIGQSPDFSFPDNAGNIIYKNAFSVVNAKPNVKIIAPTKLAPSSKTNLQVAAIDSFGGSIVKCEVAINNNNFADVKTLAALAKMSATSGSSINETFPVTTNAIDSVVNVYVKVTDNDNNTTIDTSTIPVKAPKVTVTESVVSAKTNEEALFRQNDSVKITLTGLTSDDPQITIANIAKIEWSNSISSWKTLSSFNTPIYTVVDTTNLLSNGTYEYKGVSIDGQIPVYNVTNAYVNVKITFNNGYIYNTTGNSFPVILSTIRFE